MKRTKSTNTKQLMVKIDEELYSKVVATALKEDRSIPALFRVAVREYLDKKPLQIEGYYP